MATILDIAHETGFSLMTVSRAFNFPEKVKPSTLKTILDKAEELNYSPNSVARSLARKRTSIVYVYIPEELAATEPFVMQTVAAIGEKLGEHEYSFLLSRKLPRGGSYDGVIYMGMTEEEETQLARRRVELPSVLYGNNGTFKAWVDVDNYAGETLAVQYLIDSGRRNIAYLAAPQKMHYAAERLAAYRDCLNGNNSAVSEKNIIETGNSVNGGYEGAKKLFADSSPDAVVCATDTIAVGCIKALTEMNIRVPEDVAVMGFDGLGYENVATPRLSTVRQPLYETGVKLAEVLVSMMNGGEPVKVKLLPTLVINKSA